MRTITSRKELIAGIKAGERHFRVVDKVLFLECKTASKFQSVRDATKAMIAESFASACNSTCGIHPTTAVVIAATSTIGVISIVAILKGKNLRIKVKDFRGNEAQVDVF